MPYKRTDANQKEIVKGLRALPGVTVFCTHIVSDGFPDIIVGYEGRNYLIEIKDGNKPPSARKLTKDEVKFHNEWTGQVDIAENLDQAMDIIGWLPF